MNNTLPVGLPGPVSDSAPQDNMTCLSCNRVNFAKPEMGPSQGPEIDPETSSESTPDTDLGRVYFTCIALLVILATVFGNTLVIVAVCTKKRLRKVGNSFIVNLAISDLVVGLFVAPLALVHYLDQEWNLGPIFCDIWVSTDVVCCTASIVNLCVISFDRYNAITSPLQYAFKRTPKRAAIIIAFVWLYSFLIAAPPLLGWRNKEIASECIVSQVLGYTLFSTIGAFYIPLIIMLAMYVRIFRATLKRKQTWLPGPTCTTTTGGTQRKTEIAVLINATESVRKHYQRQNSAQSTDKEVCATSTLRVASITRISDRKGSCPRSEDSYPSAESANSSPCTSRSNSHTNNTLLEIPKFPPAETSGRTVAIRLSTNDGTALTTSFSCPANQTEETGNASSRDSADCLVHNVGFCVDGRLSPVVNRSLSGSPTSFQESSCVESADTHTASVERATDTSSNCERRRNVRKLAPLINRRRRRKWKNKISLSQEKTAARTLGIIIGGFVICWLPFFVLTLVKPLSSYDVPVIFRDTFTWMGYSNSALNPIIYTFFNPDFRVAFRSILSCLSCKK